MKREWELMYFSFEASRVFFRDIQEEAEREKEAKEAQAAQTGKKPVAQAAQESAQAQAASPPAIASGPTTVTT